ncbi:hypothetical protein OV320_2547, partial [Actinobacteria bacterium OV320]
MEPDIMEVARHFLTQSEVRSDQGQLAEAVAAAQAAVDVLHAFDPPPSAKAEYLRLLAEALHAVVQRLMQGGRVAEVGLPAREA